MPEPQEEALLSYALCSADDVMTYLFESVQGMDRNALNRLINFFTEAVQGPEWLNRELEIRERTEYHDLNDCDYIAMHERANRAMVKAPPILLADPVGSEAPPTPRIEIWNSATRPPTYPDSSKLTYYSHYTVDVKTGRVDSLLDSFRGGPQALKIVYTGGLVTPAGDAEEFPTVPADLRFACAMQVAAWWQRRKELNLDSVAFPGGGAITLMDPTRMVEQVKLTLQKYRLYAEAA